MRPEWARSGHSFHGGDESEHVRLASYGFRPSCLLGDLSGRVSRQLPKHPTPTLSSRVSWLHRSRTRAIQPLAPRTQPAPAATTMMAHPSSSRPSTGLLASLGSPSVAPGSCDTRTTKERSARSGLQPRSAPVLVRRRLCVGLKNTKRGALRSLMYESGR